jgi:hypothetical protein
MFAVGSDTDGSHSVDEQKKEKSGIRGRTEYRKTPIIKSDENHTHPTDVDDI